MQQNQQNVCSQEHLKFENEQVIIKNFTKQTCEEIREKVRKKNKNAIKEAEDLEKEANKIKLEGKKDLDKKQDLLASASVKRRSIDQKTTETVRQCLRYLIDHMVYFNSKIKHLNIFGFSTDELKVLFNTISRNKRVQELLFVRDVHSVAVEGVGEISLVKEVYENNNINFYKTPIEELKKELFTKEFQKAADRFQQKEACD